MMSYNPTLTSDELKKKGNDHFQKSNFEKAILFYKSAIVQLKTKN
jgi:hypothetical protein